MGLRFDLLRAALFGQRADLWCRGVHHRGVCYAPARASACDLMIVTAEAVAAQRRSKNFRKQQRKKARG
jgi:hypothetical protein